MNIRLAYVFCLFVICSCTKIEKEILIDNPSEEAIIMQFDGENVLEIAAGETISKLVQTGVNTFRVNAGEMLEIQVDKEQDYLLNPLSATYYIEEIEVFASEAARGQYLKYAPQVEEPVSVVEGIRIPGNYEKANDLLIEKTWEYGLKDDPRMKSGIRTKTKKDRYLLHKIHSRRDLIKLLQNDFNEEVRLKFRALEI